jgi:hypothetical protein
MFGCDNILESSNFHSIYSVSIIDPTLFMVQDLACFSPPYVMEEWETWQNRFHTFPWRLIKLKPNNIRLVREQMMQHEKHEEYEFGGECHDPSLGLAR